MSTASKTTSMVIVAIPEEDDRVWKISSDKVPHLTLLFLGDADKVNNADSILQFVEHASERSLSRFYLPVDYRGELGVDNADVLFFKKGRYDFKAVRDFRNLLLKDSNVKTAYDSTSQFEFPEHVGAAGHEWIPHLTLGYPASPANEIPDDQSRIYDVCFDRIAVWMGDFEGPEFRLKDYWDEMDLDVYADSPPLAMAALNHERKAQSPSEILEHHGVKGMKWGVRRAGSSGGGGGGGAAKKVAKTVGRGARATGRGVARVAKDTLFETKSAKEVAQREVVNQASAKFAQVDMRRIDSKYKGTKAGTLKGRLKSPLDKNTIAYRREARIAYRDRINEAVANLPSNASGTRRYEIEDKGKTNAQYMWHLKVVDTKNRVKHAALVLDDSLLGDFDVQPVFDADGFITGVTHVASALAQTEELGADFLKHYGVKGMRWGVQKSGETKKSMWDPQGHKLGDDVAKTAIGVIIPVVAPLTIPAQVRLGRAAYRAGKTRQTDKANAKFERVAKSQEGFLAIHNGAHEQVNTGIAHINKKYENVDLTKSPAKQKQYDGEAIKMMQDAYRASANSITNKHADRHLDLEFVNDGLDFKIHVKPGAPTPVTKRVVHADISNDGTVTFTGKVKRDALGHIVGFEFDDFVPQSAAHSLDFDFGSVTISSVLQQEEEEEGIEHHGVKGMKWGVRRSRSAPTAVAPHATSVVPHGDKRKTKIKTAGGQNHDASPDAIRVAAAHAKLKKSGVHALSNQELQDVQTRLNLERNVKQLVGAKTTAGKGRAFVKGLTGFGKEFNDAVNTGANTRRLVQN